MSSYAIQVITLIVIYSITALGLHIVTGIAGQFSLAQAAFFGIGAYTSALISINYPGLNFIITLLMGVIVASLAAVVVGYPSLRLKGDYLAITTLGFGEVFRIIALNSKITNGALGLQNIPHRTTLLFAFVFLIICTMIAWLLENSRIGRALKAINNDETVAETFGVKLSRYKLLAFVLSGVYAGLAGGLYAHFILYITPNNFVFMKSVEPLLYIIIGGLGSLPGVIVGTAIMVGLPELLREFAQYRMVFYGLALILLMIYRPQGILGKLETSSSNKIIKMYRKILKGKGDQM